MLAEEGMEYPTPPRRVSPALTTLLMFFLLITMDIFVLALLVLKRTMLIGLFGFPNPLLLTC